MIAGDGQIRSQDAEVCMTDSAKPTPTFQAEKPISTIGSIERGLRERHDQISRRVSRIEGDLRSAHDRDWPERAGELENDEVLGQLDEMSLVELRAIREALRRIESGNYGVCSTCGHQIGGERLSAVPTAVTCLACALGRDASKCGDVALR